MTYIQYVEVHFHTAVVTNVCSRWKAKGKCQVVTEFGFGQGCSILATVLISKMTLSFTTWACGGLLGQTRKTNVVNCNVLFIRKTHNLSLYSLWKSPCLHVWYKMFPGILPEVSSLLWVRYMAMGARILVLLREI
jgi:hypothetical protein